MTTAKKWVALALVLVLTVAMVLAGLKAYSVRAAFLHAQDSFQQLQGLASDREALATPQGLSTLRGRLARSQQDFAAFKKELAPITWLLPLTSRIPVVGRDIRAAPELVDLAINLTQAVSTLVDGVRPLVGLGSLSTSSESLGPAIEALEQGRPYFQAAAAQLEDIGRRRQALARTHPGPRAEGVLALVDTYLPQMQAVARLGLEGPGLLRPLLSAQGQLFALQQKAQDMASDPIAILENRKDLADLVTGLDQVGDDLRLLAIRLDGFSAELAFLSRVPALGGDMRAAPLFLRRAAATARAAGLALAGAQGLADLAGQGLLTESFGRMAEQRLAEARDDFQAALAELRDMPRIEADGVSLLLSDPMEKLEKSAARLEQGLESGLDYLSVAETVLGYDRPKTFLILGQKEEELRATGGFVGTVWELTLDKGAITRLRFMYSYEVDDPKVIDGNPVPPSPMYKYMWAGRWAFRDANWYADFPASAQLARDLYERGQGVRADGIIALTKRQMAYIVQALGPIRVPEAGVVATADNVEQLLFAPSFPTGEGAPTFVSPRFPGVQTPYSSRVWFAQLLGNALYDRLRQGFSSLELDRLSQALLKGLREKQVLIYMEDERLQAILRQRNWDGALLSPEGDYLLLVDHNLYGGEISQDIQRRLDYQVTLSDSEPAFSRLTASLHNTAEDPSNTTRCVQAESCYWTYLRIYVPADSTIVGAPELPLLEGSLFYQYGAGRESNTFTATQSEGDKLVLGGFLTLPYGQQKEITIEYQRPVEPPLEDGQPYSYQLLVQRQPGTAPTPVTIYVFFPEGWILIQAQPKPQEVEPGLVVFHAFLDTDRAFSAVFLR